MNIREGTLEKSHMSAMFLHLYSLITIVFILEKSFMSVLNVGNLLATNPFFLITREFTLEKDLMRVVDVENLAGNLTS